MLLDPNDINWATADDSTVYYAARDGVPQAVAELTRREAKLWGTSQAVKTAPVKRRFNRH